MVKAIIVYEGIVYDRLPQLVKNDFGNTILLNILNENNTVFDLTDCEVVFKAKKLNGFGEYLINKNCVITSETTGESVLLIDEDELLENDSFLCSLVITKTENNIVTLTKTLQLGYLEVLD